jgi:CubicO group peptidase (beta-lactamase class C family)
VAENAANGVVVGLTAQASDPDGDPVTYSLSNNAGGRFAIDPSTGIVTVANANEGPDALNDTNAAANAVAENTAIGAAAGVGYGLRFRSRT